MISNLICKILNFIIIALGINSSYTDIKRGKIYNNHLIIFFIPGIVLQILYLKSLSFTTVKMYLINLIAAIFFSIMMYVFKIWAAGDAKLVMLIVGLMPMEMYRSNPKNIFPGFSIIVLIFLCGFGYLILESLFLYMKDRFLNADRKYIKHIDIEELKRIILRIIFAWIISINLNRLIVYFFKNFYLYNFGLYMILNALLILYLTRYANSKKIFYWVTILGVLTYVFSTVYLGTGNIHLNVKLMAFVIVLILFRALCGKYNYKNVSIENLKPGMLLSSGTVFNFYNSKIKGLPEDCSESMSSRLTYEEIESIKLWQKTKNGSNEVVIVRKIHFAPFIFLGTVISLIMAG
ncbi:prepilin peptidase [Clostridium ljungdahlii]|uniref:Prepilin type IV endopeptidase peptidase domain-containing protein n=1 Tax=Clostridium ljungdahlii TaxID=1538 RepID=A0A162LAR9_9CLOT|nr:prepilin peptidase [Clostridium ljungdahlii]OAA91086.1 hypothetical protein WY13_00916 [Clostridium ljungdahlii]